MSPFKRLNGGMLVGLACALLLLYHIWEWWFSEDLAVRDKMFATVIFLSTIGVMFWFSGDNASRDKATAQRLDRIEAKLDQLMRQVGAPSDRYTLLEKQLGDIRALDWDQVERAKRIEQAVDALPAVVRTAVGQAKAEGYVNGVQGRLIRQSYPAHPDRLT